MFFNRLRILALVPGGISDQLLFFPALDDIKRAYPNAEIGVVVEPQATVAYRVSKIVDTVIPFTFSAVNSPSDWANLLGLVRDREYEVAITTDLTWKMGLLLWLSGVPTRVTYASTGASWFYTATVPDKSQANAQYQAERYHDLLKAIDIDGPAPDIAVNVPEGDLAWANALRDRLDIKSTLGKIPVVSVLSTLSAAGKLSSPTSGLSNPKCPSCCCKQI